MVDTAAGAAVAEPKQKVTSEVYYSSDNAMKYYSIVNSVDYSGMGIWLE